MNPYDANTSTQSMGFKRRRSDETGSGGGWASEMPGFAQSNNDHHDDSDFSDDSDDIDTASHSNSFSFNAATFDPNASGSGSGSGPVQPIQQNNQRKRISRACDPCRKKRAKCSGDVPCALCVAKPAMCVYAPIPVKQSSKKKADQKPRKDPVVTRPGPSAPAPAPSPIPQQFHQHPTQTLLSPSPLNTSLDTRLAVVESVLSKIVPNCLSDESVRNAIEPLYFHRRPDRGVVTPQQLESTQLNQPVATNSVQYTALHTRNIGGVTPSPSSLTVVSPAPIKTPVGPEALQTQPPSSLLPQQHSSSTTQVPSKPTSTFKTGGFLTDSDEQNLTFWGSTSALGGTANKAHIYKSIPRFQNGVLQSHKPPVHQNAIGSKPNSINGSATNTPQPAGSTPTIHQQSMETEEGETLSFHDLIPLPHDLVDHILKNFWEQFHPQFPLLEKSWFNNQLDHLRSLPSISIPKHWRFCLVLTSVVALMINFTPSLSHWKRSDTPAAQSSADSSSSTTDEFKDHDVVLRKLCASFKKIVFEYFEIADIFVIQSLLMMVLAGGMQRGSRYTGFWSYMGMAVRMSHELGLHRSISELGVQHPRFNREAMAIRNRTWHCVMIMETYTCIWTGRPLAIHDDDWDADYPEVTSPEMATLKQHIDLAQILASILRFANRAREVDTEAVIKSIDIRLRGWWNALDPDWRNLVFPERWNSKASMALMYHGSVILFHRMAFNRIDQQSCLDSANAISTLLSRFEKPLGENECFALFPSFTYCAMLSCTVHISQMLLTSNIAGTSGSNSERLVTAVSNLDKCMRVFDSLRGVFVAAERCWKTILDFLTVKGVRLEDLVEAAKNGSAIAAAVAGMNDLAGVGEGAGAGSGAGVAPAREVKTEGSGASVVVGGFHPSESVGLGSWPSGGFFNEALARTTSPSLSGTNPMMQATASMSMHQTVTPSPRNAIRAMTGGNAFSSIPGQPRTMNSAASSILASGGGDMGFIWDGLSLFDLAGLGGLANADFSILAGTQQPIPSSQQFSPSNHPLMQPASPSIQQHPLMQPPPQIQGGQRMTSLQVSQQQQHQGQFFGGTNQMSYTSGPSQLQTQFQQPQYSQQQQHAQHQQQQQQQQQMLSNGYTIPPANMGNAAGYLSNGSGSTQFR